MWIKGKKIEKWVEKQCKRVENNGLPVGHQPAEIWAEDDHEYTKNHLSEWFPKLPSYRAFSDRLNRLAPAFQALAEHWMSVIGVGLCEHREYIVDSCPIILAKGSRSGCAQVARELCEKSYNPSRDEWYYGLKLHAVVARRLGLLPLSPALMASGAAQHDLPAGNTFWKIISLWDMAGYTPTRIT